MNQDALKKAISKEIERLLKTDDTISCTKRIDPLSIAPNIDERKCVNESPTSINGYNLNLPHQEHQTYHFMLSNHSGDAAPNTTEICKGKRDNHLDTKNQATIFDFCQRTGTIEGIYHYFLKILLDAQNQNGRNWKCNYCHKSEFKIVAQLNTENVSQIDQDFSSQLGQNNTLVSAPGKATRSSCSSRTSFLQAGNKVFQAHKVIHMTTKEVSTAKYFGSMSHLCSNAAETEKPLRAGDLGRIVELTHSPPQQGRDDNYNILG